MHRSCRLIPLKLPRERMSAETVIMTAWELTHIDSRGHRIAKSQYIDYTLLYNQYTVGFRNAIKTFNMTQFTGENTRGVP